MLKNVYTIFYLEIVLLLRHSQQWLYPLVFFIIALSLFPLALTPDPIWLQKYFAGIVWIVALFASLLSIEQIYLSDREDHYLEQIFLGSTSPALFLLAKNFAYWLVTQFPLILITPILASLFQLPLHQSIILCGSLLLGTPILILLGSFGVALTAGLKQQGVFLSLLILPLLTPVVIFGVNIVQQAQAHFAILGPLSFLAGITILAITCMPWAISASLRISLED